MAYSWKRTLENSFVQSIYTEVTPHIFASLNGKLYFSEIQKVDAGEYYCQVDLFGLSNNAVGAAQPPSRTSYPIEVNVQDQGMEFRCYQHDQILTEVGHVSILFD